MISVKTGTQTWSNSAQKTDLPVDKNISLSADEQAKYYGEQDIGEVLNKVADPNWIDPSKKPRGAGKQDLDKDAFMKLLLTQMKNQDPTNPMKSHEMAAQLAQFTSLEKLQNIDTGISGLRKDMTPNQKFDALALIGKSVTTDAGKITRTEAQGAHSVFLNLGADALKVDVTIKDSEDKVVRELTFNNLKAGKNEFVWNGQNEVGGDVPAGDYHLEFSAYASNGSKLFVDPRTEGLISGVNFTARGPQLVVGKQVISLAEVQSVSSPSAFAAPTPAVATGASATIPGAATPTAPPAGSTGSGPVTRIQESPRPMKPAAEPEVTIPQPPQPIRKADVKPEAKPPKVKI